MNKFYITTPIYYVNDKPHIGHAYTTVLADVLARWHKLQGEDVFFLTGTDEHGAKIEEAAEKAGKKPQDFCDEKAEEFKIAWQSLNISYNNFIRTTDEDHKNAVQKALDYLFKKELIYKGEYKGLYCKGCEQYLTDDDLVDGLCPDHRTKPEVMKEESYFFKLSQFGPEIERRILSGELLIEPISKKNEVINFINQGLQDISISRKNVKWGISLPFDKKFTTYVWIDAFFNYLTGLSWVGKIPPNSPFLKGGEKEDFDFWPPDIQLMSKDILRVHATIWLALLLALEISLPRKFYIHGYFTINEQKMSKSLGNVIWPEELVEKFSVDGARYLLISSLAYGHDGDVSWEKLTEKYNADLANGLGNLVSRVATLNQKSRIKLHNCKSKFKNRENINKLFEEIKPKEILEEIWKDVSWANKYIEENKLWELVKNDETKAGKILEEILSTINYVAENLRPFMPETSEKILKILEVGKTEKSEILFPRV